MYKIPYKNKISISVSLMIGLIAAAALVVILISFGNNSIAITVATPKIPAQLVQVGGGDPTSPLFGYKPQNVAVKVGQSVVWTVPFRVPAEPHTVTFVFDNSTMTLGFLIQNQRVFNPAIINPKDVTLIYHPDASLVINGTEKYVNSGWLFPKGAGLPGTSTTFTATFQNAGTYKYLCLLHPWMTGEVKVS